ncbi:chromatin assembly factor 1 subunit A-A [Nilaparvata lugens]|uniref:chromatin assembly factor 1 subunit A-A n=1 Tax=Nilaparvata lugens TaxID=108931 RepID=UPI00193D64DD|nr:chromatin assembly factor 1 subunit A-A [Nilaparvata lugens]
MKTPKDEDTVDLTGSSKKMKQARLPFKLLTPKLADAKNNGEISDKDKAQRDKSTDDQGAAKENAKTEEVIVLEDSVEMTEQFNEKSETENSKIRNCSRKRSISVSPNKKVAARKKQKTTKSEATTVKSESATEKEDADQKTECEADKLESPKKKTLKRSAASLLDSDTTKSPSKTDCEKRESPRKKRVKEEDENAESLLDSDTTKSPSKTDSVKRESPRKKRVKEEKDNVKQEDESPSKRQSSRLQSSIKNIDNKGKSILPTSTEKNSDNDEENDGKKRTSEITPRRSGRQAEEEVRKEKSGETTPQDESSKSRTPASASKTPKTRKLTPNQLEKQKESAKKKAEREQKLLEKERLKKEKEDQMNKLKEEKLKMKQDKEEQKKREKEEKEELRKKEKEEKEELRKKEKDEKERKRLAEIEQKNEAKRLKEEEKKKQNEAREEERRKRDEAKEEEKRKKDAEKRKAAEAFASFFKPKESSTPAEETDVEMEVDGVEKFMPFEVKGDMRLSSMCRRSLDEASKSTLDSQLASQSEASSQLYIDRLKSKRHTPMTSERTWPRADESDDEVIIIEAEVNEENGHENTSKEVHKEKKAKRFKAKLLQFDENRRPPYWGTWRKKSATIGARRPFNLDKTIFEYDVDSDDEWEEEEPGESLRGSDDENEKESEDEYEVDNKVFVPHGYLSDEEMQEDDLEDCSREAQKAKLHLLEIEFQAEMNQKTEKLKPRLIGCVWFANSVSDPSTVGSRIAEMLLSRRMVLFGLESDLPIEPNRRQSPAESTSSSPVTSPLHENTIGRKSKFPESAIPMLVKLVHGNQNKLSFLVREFSSYLTRECQSTLDVPSMTAIRHKIRHLAKWMPFLAQDSATCPLAGKMCWYVGKDIREKYAVLLNDSDLISDAWSYILPAPKKSALALGVEVTPVIDLQSPKSASITKFTKKMTEQERKKQLLQVTYDSGNAASKKPTPCKTANLLATFVGLKDTPSVSDQPPSQPNHNSTKKCATDENAQTKPLVKKRVQLTTLRTFGVNSITKESSSVVEKCDKLTTELQERTPKSSKITDLLNVSRTPDEPFLGFEAVDVEKSPRVEVRAFNSENAEEAPKVESAEEAPKVESAAPSSKTPRSESRASKSIASFFTKGGSNKMSAKKLFDGKQGTADVCTEKKHADPARKDGCQVKNGTATSSKDFNNEKSTDGDSAEVANNSVPCDNCVDLTSQQTPAKKRVKVTTISPPKWRVKLAKPPPPTTHDKDDDDDDVILIE